MIVESCCQSFAQFIHFRTKITFKPEPEVIFVESVFQVAPRLLVYSAKLNLSVVAYIMQST